MLLNKNDSAHKITSAHARRDELGWGTTVNDVNLQANT
jgi:hypothetical protein